MRPFRRKKLQKVFDQHMFFHLRFLLCDISIPLHIDWSGGTLIRWESKSLVKVGWTGQHVYWFPVASCVVPQYKKGPEFERFITNRLLTVQLLRHTSSSEAFLEISFVYNEICSGKVLNLFGFLFLRNYVYVYILLISERFLPSLWHALWPRRQPQAQANLPLPIPHPQAAMTQMESWNDPLLPLW